MKSRLNISEKDLAFGETVVFIGFLTILQLFFAANATIKSTWPEFAQPFGHLGFDVLFATFGIFLLRFRVEVSMKIVIGSALSLAVLILVISQKFHTKVSNIIGFPAMANPSADWESIYNYAHCSSHSRSNACDAYGRPWAYGSIWKIFAVVPNPRLFLYLGYAAFIFGISALVWAIRLISPSGTLIIISSPAVFMIAERLNSDTLLLGAVIVICANLHHLPDRILSMATIVVSCVLAAAKPFFGILYIRQSVPRRTLVLGALSAAASIYISYGSYANIVAARKATLYSLSSQFGADMIGALVVPHESFFIHLLWGMAITTAVAIWLLRRGISHAEHLILRQDPLKYNLILASAAMFSLSYLSGSQVFYKTILGLPFALWFFASVSHSNKRIERYFGLLVVLGSLGVGGTIIRTLATTCLAVSSVEFILNYLKLEMVLKIRT